MRGRLGVVRWGCGKAGTALLRGAECVRGNETGLFEAPLLFEAARPFRCGGMRRSFRTPERGAGGTQSGALGWYTVSRWDTRPGRPCYIGSECVRGNETGLFEAALAGAIPPGRPDLLARASIRRFRRWGHRQDARATFGSGIEVGGGVGVGGLDAVGKCGEVFAFRWWWG